MYLSPITPGIVARAAPIASFRQLDRLKNWR